MPGIDVPVRVAQGPRGPHAGVPQLQTFLSSGRLEIIDVARGAALGTRRLVVGKQQTSRPIYVVSAAISPDGEPQIEAEARHLVQLRHVVRPALRDTLPSIVGRVEVSDLSGVVLTAVPGLHTRSSGRPLPVVNETGPVLAWLTMLWSDTAGKTAPVEFGREAHDLLLDRFAGSRRAAAALGALDRSRTALADRETARTVSHGCLCPRHLRVRDGHTIGADDWGKASFGADPLRDIGTWVVRAAGPGIVGVFAGRTPYGRSLRDFVVAGLAYWGLSSRLWRDVLVVALAEEAVHRLEEKDGTALDLLNTISHGLSGRPTTERSRP